MGDQGNEKTMADYEKDRPTRIYVYCWCHANGNLWFVAGVALFLGILFFTTSEFWVMRLTMFEAFSMIVTGKHKF